MKNNAFRKTLSVLVSVCLLLACFPSLGILAAAGTVTSFSLSPSPITIPEGANSFTSVDPDNNPFTEYDVYRLVFSRGNVLTVSYSDGTTVRYEYTRRRTPNGFDDLFVNPNDDSDTIPSADIQISDDQYTDHWMANNTYFVRLSYGNKSSYLQVNVVPNPITSITPSSVTLIEGSYAHEETDGNNQPYLRYDFHRLVSGEVASLLVSYNDGRGVVNYNFIRGISIGNGEYRDAYVNQNDGSDYILLGDINFDDRQDTEHWTSGNQYAILCNYQGCAFTIPVTVVESPLTSISLNFDIENPEGLYANERTDDNGDPFFEYDTYRMLVEYPAELTVTFRDNSTVTYENTGIQQQNGDFSDAFVNPNDDTDFILFDDLEFEDTQWDDHWEIGGPYSFTVTFLGKTATASVTIVANPIKSISFTPSALTALEGNDVQSRTDASGNPYDEYDLFNLICAFGNTITVVSDKDSDGVDETTVYRFEEIVDPQNGNHIRSFFNTQDQSDYLSVWSLIWEHDQFNVHWQVGGTYPVLLKALGRSCTLTVTVQPNPVSSISITPATLTVQEGMYARTEYTDGGQPFDHYDFWEILRPQNAVMTVNYANGTTGYYDFDNRNVGDRWSWVFVNQNDDTDYITDDQFWWDDDQWDSPWQAGNTYNVVVRAFGRTTTVPVTITVNPVASISLTPGSLSVQEGMFTRTDYDNNGQPFDNYDFWMMLQAQHAALTVTYTDNTTAVYDFDNRDVNGRGRWVFVNRNDDTDFTYDEEFWCDDGQWDAHWQPGNTYNVDLQVFGRKVTVPVTVTANPVASISLTPASMTVQEGMFAHTDYDDNGQPFDNYDFWMMLQAQHAALTVTYTDNTTAVYDFDNRDVNGRGRWVFVNRNDDTDFTYDEEFWCDDGQWDAHWQPGNTYNVDLQVFGRKVTVPVTVAVNPVASISLTPGSLSVQEGEFSRTDYDNNGQPFDNYDYWQVLQTQHAYMTVTYTDSTTAVYDFENREINGQGRWVFVNRNDDSDILIDGESFWSEENQWDNHWTVGTTNNLIIHFLGRTTTVPFVVTANPVASIALTPGSLTVQEGMFAHTDYDDNGQPFDNYDFWMMLQAQHAALTVTYTDNTTAVYDFDNRDVNGSGRWVFVNRNDDTDFTYDEEFRYEDSQWDAHWQPGNTYNVDLKVFGRKVTVPVTVAVNPVASISVAPNTLAFTEGIFANMEGDGNQSFLRYDLWQMLQSMSAVLTVNNVDNTTDVYDFDNREYNGRQQWVFVNQNDDSDIIPESDFWYEDDQWDDHWTAGNNYDVVIHCKGRTATVNVAITANPIASVSLTNSQNNSAFSLYEQQNGHVETDEHGYDFFRYDLFKVVFREGNTLMVTYTDNTVKTYVYTNYCEAADREAFVNTNDPSDYIVDRDIRFDDTQWDDHWTAGNTYTASVSFSGRSAAYTVSIIDNPIRYISLSPAAFTITVGDMAHEEIDDGGNPFLFYEPWNILFRSNALLTVFFTDNTSKTYYHGQIDQYTWGYINQQDAADTIPDRELDFLEDQREYHWTAGNTYTFDVEYCGRTVSVSVELQANPISAISCTPSWPYVTEGARAETRTDGSGLDYLHYDLWPTILNVGSTFSVTYNDGRGTVVYTMGLIPMPDGGMQPGFVNLNDPGDNPDLSQYLPIIDPSTTDDYIRGDELRYDDTQQTTHWVLGGTYPVMLSYRGYTCTVNLTVTGAPELTKTLSAENSIVIDTQKTLNGALAGCIYGFPAQATAPDAAFYTDHLQVENGMISVEPSPYTQNGYGTGTQICVYDQTHELIATYAVIIIGDVTGDGVVDGDDYDICRGAALDPTVYGQGDELRAMANDVNGDEVLDVLDCRQVKLLSQGKSVTC